MPAHPIHSERADMSERESSKTIRVPALATATFVFAAFYVRRFVFPQIPEGWQHDFAWIGPAIAATVALLVAIPHYGWKDRFTSQGQSLGFAVSSSGVCLSEGGITLAQGAFFIASDLVLSLWAEVCLLNVGSPASTSIKIASIGPPPLSSCLLDAMSPEDIDLEVEYRRPLGWAPLDLGNPFTAETGDRHIMLRARIPFSVLRLEEHFGAIGEVKTMQIALQVNSERTPVSLNLPPLTFDLSPVHRRTDADFVNLSLKYHVGAKLPPAEQLPRALTRYFEGPHSRNGG